MVILRASLSKIDGHIQHVIYLRMALFFLLEGHKLGKSHYLLFIIFHVCHDKDVYVSLKYTLSLLNFLITVFIGFYENNVEMRAIVIVIDKIKK